jgi:Septum formation
VSEQPPNEPQLQDPLAEPRWAGQQLAMPDPLAEPRWATDVLAESGWRQAEEAPPLQWQLLPQPQADWPAAGQPPAAGRQPAAHQRPPTPAYRDLPGTRSGRPTRGVLAAAGLALLVALGVAAALLPSGRHPAIPVTARPTPGTHSVQPAPATSVEPAPQTTPASTEPGSPVTGGIRAGDCLNTQNTGNEILRLPCSQPHDEEVFAHRDLADLDWPGEAALFDQAERICSAAATSFIGIPADRTGLMISWFEPGEPEWREGDHTIDCTVADPNGKTTGTLRGSRR